MIQIKNRKFTMTQEERFIGVTGENNVETRQFVIDRMFNGIDLSTLSCFMEVIPINIENPPYINVIETEINGEQLLITWIVKSHDLVNSGKLYFDIKFVSTENMPVGNGTVEETYIVFQTNRDYFKIGEDAINATEYSQDIPPSALEQAVAKATEQANISSEQARIATSKASEASTILTDVTKAKNDIITVTNTALDAVADGVTDVERASAQVEDSVTEAKRLVAESTENTIQANISANKAQTAAEQVTTDKSEITTMKNEVAQNTLSAQQSATSAQKSKESAELAAGKTSYIGDNGYWFEWSTTLKSFVDTGIKAQGPQGLQGVQGAKGEQGARGLQGAQGEKGLQGERGLQGIQGIQGIQGERGFTGPIGKTGEQGIQGIRGEQGEKGADGIVQTVDSQVGFEISNGHLFIVSNDITTASNYSINENGHLILDIKE